VLRNRRARILVGVLFLEMLGYNALVTLMPYLTEYVLETPGSTAYYLFAAIATTLATIPLWIVLSRRFEKVPVWNAALMLKVAVFAGFTFVGAGDWLLIGILTVAFGASSGASAVLGPSLKADVVDSDEALTGERKEGTFFAAWGFAIKAAIGCAIALSGLVLESTGFRPGVPQTPEALLGIRALVSVFPLACHLVAIALLRRLDIDAVAHAEIFHRIRMHRAGSEIAPALPCSLPLHPSSTRPAGHWEKTS
jgi:GPH family glycoside/pentoside/hexuronide:cation symporter